MSKDKDDTAPRPAETIWGQILIGICIAAGSALIGWFVSRATYVPPPLPKPIVEITPSTLLAQANAIVEFSAKGSITPSTKAPDYHWQVGGLEPNDSPVARCQESGAVLSCRFALPGTFSVSVDVVDAYGETGSAASAVTVSLPGGYLGVMLAAENPDALRALLYDVDWVQLQSLVARPIILLEPSTQKPVYAALAEPPADAGDPPSWRGAAEGLRIAIPRLPGEAGMQFERALLEIGLAPVAMPVSEVYNATLTGFIDAGFVRVDSPGELATVFGGD